MCSMINEAYNLLAVNEARIAARAMNSTLLSYVIEPEKFCDIVLGNGNNASSPLHGSSLGPAAAHIS